MRQSRRPDLKLVQNCQVEIRLAGSRCLIVLMSLARRTPADVAELVDALVSGTSGSNVVGVQVSPSALS